MKYEEWKPLYQEICDYFSFDPAEDEQAARIARSLSSASDIDLLTTTIQGKAVTVCGNAPCLKDQLREPEPGEVIIAADAAAAVLLKAGIRPAVIVTDLDGIDEYALEMNKAGTIMVVHAHGDNIPRLQTWIPRFIGPLVITTQGEPFDTIHNFGGFSDGDRAVFMAEANGAASVRLIGFDCDDPGVTPVKKGKLLWARRLLTSLGYDC